MRHPYTHGNIIITHTPAAALLRRALTPMYAAWYSSNAVVLDTMSYSSACHDDAERSGPPRASGQPSHGVTNNEE